MTTAVCECVDRALTTWRGACFNAERTHRFSLWSRWDARRLLVALMLNPSTADEHVLDPTLRRVEGFAQQWGCGGFVILNAFALRSTDPAGLLPDPHGAVGEENDAHIAAFLTIPDALFMVGWGGNVERSELRFRKKRLRELIGDRAMCWGQNADGSPRHPLYLAKTTEAVPFVWTELA